MDQSPPMPEQAFVDALRRRRAELRESMSALELVLAAPAPEGHPRWAERIHVPLCRALRRLPGAHRHR